MNVYKNTVKLVCKKHVARYLSVLLADDDNNLIVAGTGIFWSVIKCLFTKDASKRVLTIPEEYTSIEIRIPRKYGDNFTSQETIVESVKNTEEFFWIGAVGFISLNMKSKKLTKEAAISLFLKQFGITESIYPLDHFRRQLHRKGLTPGRDHFENNTISIKYSDEVCKKIANLYHTGKSSAGKLSKHYNISKGTVFNIHKKVYKGRPIIER